MKSSKDCRGIFQLLETSLYLFVFMTLMFCIYTLVNVHTSIQKTKIKLSILSEELELLRNNLVAAGSHRGDVSTDWGWILEESEVLPNEITVGLASIPNKDLSVVLPTVLDKRKLDYLLSKSSKCVFSDLDSMKRAFFSTSTEYICFTFFGLFSITEESQKGSLLYISIDRNYFVPISSAKITIISEECGMYYEMASGLEWTIGNEELDHVCLIRDVLIYDHENKKYCPGKYIHCLYLSIR